MCESQESSFILLHLTILFSQNHSLKRLVFHSFNCFNILVEKASDCKYEGLFPNSQFFSIDLYVDIYVYQSVNYCFVVLLKSRNMSPPNLFFFQMALATLVVQMVKRLPAIQETWVQSLDQEDLLEKEMATHSSTLAWKIPWTEEPGRLQSMGWQRVGHD